MAFVCKRLEGVCFNNEFFKTNLFDLLSKRDRNLEFVNLVTKLMDDIY